MASTASNEAPGDLPLFSVVVPTFQRRDMVCEAVTAIDRMTLAQPFEIIVVVDGSTDGTAAALAALQTRHPLQVAAQENCGPAAARNRGAALARGQYLLFLDDDMICREDLLEQLAGQFAGGADAVLGDLPLDPKSPPGLLRDELADWSRDRSARLRNSARLTVDDMLSGQLSVRRDVYRELGGFDPAFTRNGSYGNEDRDLGIRLMRQHDVRFCPEAVSWQRYLVTPPASLRQAFQSGRADVLLARKYLGHADEIFASHWPQARKTRLLIRPLARLSAMASLARLVARLVAGPLYGRHPLLDRLCRRAFVNLREVVYWSGVASLDGGGEASA